MVTLEEFTVIKAPVERCFDLARTVEVLRELLRERNAAIKQIAESADWERYLGPCG